MELQVNAVIIVRNEDLEQNCDLEQIGYGVSLRQIPILHIKWHTTTACQHQYDASLPH